MNRTTSLRHHTAPRGTSLLSSLVLAAGLVVALPGGTQAQVGIDPVPAVEAVPAADCGPGSRPETGIQGQVPKADRDSGRSTEGYQCNLELVGTHQHGEGASWQFAWYEDCAYYGTLDNPSRVTANGAVVVDVTEPTNPVGTALLDTPAVNDPHESLKVNQARGLLAAGQLGGSHFDVYDVSEDCMQPRLLSSTEFAGTAGHEGDWAPDGRTYYSAPGAGEGNVHAIDVSDPTAPEIIYTFPRAAHGLSISDDGTRAYVTSLATRQGLNGVVIFDVTDIQDRVPDPQTPVVGELYWADGALAQHTIPVTIQGSPYLIHVDEAGRGATRIIDISDETSPQVVSKLKLEAQLPQNEPLVAQEWGAQGIFVYDAHYCSVDRRDEPTVLACGYFESGIRVFDIRDPLNPREIAYWIPPAITDRPLPGSAHNGDHTADRCSAQVRVVPPRVDPTTGQDRAPQLWTQCQDNELVVLEMTNDVWPVGPPADDDDPPDPQPPGGDPPDSPPPACPSGEVPVFAGGGTNLTNGAFFPGTAVYDGQQFQGVPHQVGQGCDLRFVNADFSPLTNSHRIVSFDRENGRPLFASDTVAGPGETTIETSHLPPGVYPYYCAIHFSMYGQIEIRAVP